MKDEMDILREVGSIAAGHASVALSEILKRKIGLEMPSLAILPAEAIAKKVSEEHVVVSVSCNILSGLKGEILFVLDEKSTFKLVDMCYHVQKPEERTGIFTEMGLSLIKEVGNVIISSYVGALSMILKTIVIPSIPTLVSGTIRQTLNMAINPYSKEEYILFTEAVFLEPTEKITGSFYLILNPEAMKHVQDACKKILESVK